MSEATQTEPLTENTLTYEQQVLARRLVKDTSLATKEYAAKFGQVAPPKPGDELPPKPRKAKKEPVVLVEPPKAAPKPVQAEKPKVNPEHAKFFVRGKKKTDQAKKKADDHATRAEVRVALKDQKEGGGVSMADVLAKAGFKLNVKQAG